MKRLVITMLIILFASTTYSQDISNDLITTDIGPYKKITKGGPSGNILAGVDHFGLDHKDITYGISYVNDETKMWIDVQVTQHAGSDSDRWLLHEVDIDFRNYYGIPGEIYGPRQINGQTILTAMAGGGNYRWLSGNKVIMIEYHDAQLAKPEPIEIIQAYLAKHPSTLQSFSLAQLRNADNEIKWIKDEIDRRLWLCDKWVAQKEAGKVDVNKLLNEMHDHMKVFINYRGKYYGIASTDDKNAIYGYMQAKDETAMKNKLTEYKTWWADNKDKAISL